MATEQQLLMSYKTANLIKRGDLEIGDGYRAKNSEMGPSGLPFARAGNIDGGFHFDGADLLDERYIARAGAKISRPGDIVFTSKGTVGRFALVQDDTPKFVYSPQLCYWRVKNNKCINSQYLFYWMHSGEFQRQMDSVKSQTDMAEYVSLSDQRSMSVTLPPLAEQVAVATTLGAIDDKLDLNRRMNETLEQIGQTLFRAWFVDFEPVRAKIEGRIPPAMGAKTAALFPDTMTLTDLGEVPTGWRVGTLGEVAVSVRQAVQPEDVAPDTPYIGLEHMPRRSIALSEWGRAGDVGSAKSGFRAGDILFGKLRPYFHKVGVAVPDGVCSTDIVVLRPKAPAWFGFTLFHVSGVDFVNYTDAHAAGTKMPRTNWPDMARYEVALPPAAVAEAFNEIVAPLVARIRANVLQSRTLAALRDALLPKLLSGEIRVPTEEQTEV